MGGTRADAGFLFVGMNNTTSIEDDDFRFCYAGNAGTRTGLHRDGESV